MNSLGAIEVTMFTSAWRLSGITGSEAGHLELNSGRLIYTPLEGTGFNVPLGEVREVTFPWYYLGGGVKFRIGAEKYRFSFIEPHNDNADVSAGRQTGKAWKKVLLG